MRSRTIFSENLVVFADAKSSFFTVVQSHVHETWVEFTSSTLEDRQGYRPSDCFETFPFPERFEADPRLEAAGEAYYEFRAALMVRNNEGLTKTYNRFHDPNETSPDIARLRELHAAMDRAVLDAYGWTDIPTDCQFLLDYEDDEDEDDDESFSLSAAPTGRKPRTRKKPWRYRWPDEIRDEVLARLLALNAKRAEEERLSGAATQSKNAKKSGRGRNPYVTPTFDEYAMFLAFAASLSSADLSRQVGAVVAIDDQVVATGANDCPKAGGGRYWPRLNKSTHFIEDQPDGRDYKRKEDSNRVEQLKIIDDIVKRASAAGLPPENAERLREELEGSRVRDLTEFGRVVHAEMDALLTCMPYRRGRSTDGRKISLRLPLRQCRRRLRGRTT